MNNDQTRARPFLACIFGDYRTGLGRSGFTSICAGCILVLLLLASSAVAQTPEQSTVRVYCFINKGGIPDSTGSGVLVSHNQILTCYHVCVKRRQGNQSVMIRFSDGFRTWGTVEAENKRMDVCLIRINSHPEFQPMELGSDPKKQDTVDTYGFTYDYEFIKRTGIVSVHRRVIRFANNQTYTEPDPKGPWFQINGSQSVPGDSGGPVILNDKIVGIVNSTGSNITVATGIDGAMTIIGKKLNDRRNSNDIGGGIYDPLRGPENP